MLKEERHQHILAELRIRNRILLADIAQKLAVSEDTVRRDLKDLHDRGQLLKVHGGAIAKSFTPFSFHQEEIYDHPNKQAIAKKALSVLRDGLVILITGGTTNLEFVSVLPPGMHLTIFTPSLQVAMQLTRNKSIETILIGGRVSPDAQVSIGAEALNTLASVKADICFLGTGHLHPVDGLSEFDWEVVQLKRAMIKSSRQTISLALSAKLNSTQRYKICDIHEIHTLVTELPPGSDLLKPFRKNGLEVL
ncbi:MAG: DeoR/GlpR family DNA-binding transcription regulator [Cyclobacteriaceae bacterium]|jgi:DeoR/GlpR family transcriptional regulator of sugar metabolism|nr:DeoR/GlpR family DNA-binding transcription regulator [Cyclobacteriaceae bacterium]